MSDLSKWSVDLPPSWKAKPLKTVASYSVSNVDKIAVNGQTPVRLCNYTDVYNNELINLALDFMQSTATDDEIRRFALKVDDVVITKDSESWEDIAIPALVIESADDLVCGYHLAVLRPNQKQISGRYLFRCLQSKTIRVQLELASTGVTRFGLPKNEIGKLLLPIPPLPQQRAIADFLDRETARLDGLVAAKERLLELLAEKRWALITRAVTLGLNPNVPFRDSGIPWLGPIPMHWQTARAKWLFCERNERSETGEEELFTVSHITGVTPRSEKNVNMFKAETTEGYKICHAGDLIINTLWAWMGAMGVSPMHGIASPAYHVYTPCERLDPGYIDVLVRIRVFAEEAIRFSKGVWSSRLRLYPEGFFEIWIPVPPLEEQHAIIAYIATETAKLDALRTAAERTINLLKERRTALIADAVTGKLEVK